MDDYFTKRTDDRLQRIEDKIDSLFAFKWQIIGGSAALSSLVALLVSLVAIYFTRR